ncbi:phytosulfokine precursor family protein [Salix suchowensis]|nr:phytosulfokine precursor family protein [Salix suchowensis]
MLVICKVVVLCLVPLMLSFDLANNYGSKSLHLSFWEVVEAEHAEVMEEISCECFGEEECLMRRTLAAYTDYMYTQKNKP